MIDYKKAIIGLLDHLSEKHLKRLYQLANFLFLYEE